jgi:membrane-associated protease RseP (regulator of RpoE activity)
VKVAVQRGGAKVELDVTPEAPTNVFHGPFRFESEAPLAQAWPKVEGEWKRRFPATEFHGESFPGGDSFRAFSFTGRGRLGVQVQELSDQLAGYFGVKSGVLVSDVDDGSPAAKAGVKAGDVITAVNGRNVTDPNELRSEVGKVEEGKGADLTVIRDKKTLTLKVETDAAKRTERRVRRTV